MKAISKEEKMKRFNLKGKRIKVDIFYKIATVIILSAGLVWAIYRFGIERTAARSIQLNVKPELERYSNNLSLLTINVDIKNVGKTKVNTDSITITLIEMPENIRKYEVIDERKGDTILNKINMLRRYSGEYRIEPNSEYHELETILVPRKKLYFVEVTFIHKNEGITEFKTVLVN